MVASSNVFSVDGIQRFGQDRRGGVASIFVFCIILLCGFIGGAVDYGMYTRAKFRYAEAVDAAALSAARIKQLGGTDAEALTAANTAINEVRANMPVIGNVDFAITQGGAAVEGTANLAVPAVFFKVIGINQLNFSVTNRAEFGSASDVEIALMLDTTGSMAGSKIDDLKSAVSALMDIALKDSDSSRVRIAMVPFSNAVRLKTQQYRFATGNTNGGGGCVVERTGSDVYTDATPSPGSYVVPLENVSRSACNSAQEVFPLSNKKSDLKHMVDAIAPGGSTAGHLGTAWAWYLLSPQWSGMFDSSEIPKPYGDINVRLSSGARKLRKIAVLMTDGDYNTSYNGTDSTTQARAICAEMKKTGIEVFTVGFQVGGSTTVLDTLQGCASIPSNFYPAEDGAALRRAFVDIALRASQLRLSQ